MHTPQIIYHIKGGTNTIMPDTKLYNQIQKTLHPGDTIKNYKTLCALLNEETKTGNAKIYQVKEWLRYFDYEKDKQKYIITKIYQTPLPQDDKYLYGNNSIYIKHIELLLLNYLSKQEGQQTRITLKNLFLLLGMINQYYIKEDKENLKTNSDYITDYQINHFYQRTYQKLREIIFTSLNNLRNRRLIDYEELTMVNKQEINPYTNKKYTIECEATEDEKNIIRDIEKEILINMNLENMTIMHLKFKQKEFYSQVNQLLQLKHNINYTYKDIKILFTKKYIDQALQQAELFMQRKMLNDKIVIAVNEQAQKKFNKSQKEYDEQVEEYMNHIIGKPSNMALSKFFKLTDVYLYAQQELAELLIRL